MKSKPLIALFYFLLHSILLFSQVTKTSGEKRILYNQLYSFKFTVFGFSSSAEYLLQKNRITVNIEPSVSVFPLLTSMTGKNISGLDLFLPNRVNAKITIEPKYYFLSKQTSADNWLPSISLAGTYHFPEKNAGKIDTLYSGLSIIPKFNICSGISHRIYFQGGLGYGIGFISSNYKEHSVEGTLGLDIKIAIVLFKN